MAEGLFGECLSISRRAAGEGRKCEAHRAWPGFPLRPCWHPGSAAGRSTPRRQLCVPTGAGEQDFSSCRATLGPRSLAPGSFICWAALRKCRLSLDSVSPSGQVLSVRAPLLPPTPTRPQALKIVTLRSSERS